MPLVIEPFGDAAFRLALPDAIAPGKLGDALRRVPGVLDAVVAERHALVTYLPGRPPEGIAEVVARVAATEGDEAAPRTHTIAVAYDGADLDEVARRAGLSPDEVIAIHGARAYEVVAVGFLPGFAYLGGLDPRLVGPRRAAPRVKVPANAVAIGGPYVGIYPVASPGGWQLLGTAREFVAFDPVAGAALAVGDTVRFERVEP